MRLRNAKAKGSRLEREARDILISEGYYVVKAGGSLGPADLVALRPTDGSVRFVQVKANRGPPPSEMRELRTLQVAVDRLGWLVEVWRKKDRRPWEMRGVEV